MLELQTQVFELGLDVEESQAVGERRIKVKRLVGNASLLELREGIERAHIVQAVGNLHNQHAHVLGHCEQQVAEVLGLFLGVLDGTVRLIGSLFGHKTHVAARYFCYSSHQVADASAKGCIYLFGSHRGFFYYIMQQRCRNSSRTHAYLFRHYASHSQWVADIWIAIASAVVSVGFLGKLEYTSDELHLVAFARVGIIEQQALKFLLYHQLLVGSNRNNSLLCFHFSHCFKVDFLI